MTEHNVDIHELLQNIAGEWVTQQYKEVTHPYVSVLMSQSVYEVMMFHALSDLRREVGGFIIGRVLGIYKGKRYVYAEHAIVAQHTRSNEVRLTFTSETQLDMLDRMELFFPGKQVVGWFHTHPNMSVFYSDYDVWLHSNFFSQLYQFGIVIAPVGHQRSVGALDSTLQITAGFFVWQQYEDGTKYLDPNHYTGCIELADSQKEPLIEWQNMMSIEDYEKNVEEPENTPQSINPHNDGDDNE